MRYLLECCVDSVESAINAQKGGADRLELCANLIIGGTTPNIALYRELRQYVEIPVRVLIRPRFGDFCYSCYEKNQILDEIGSWCELDIEGVVIGALDEDGDLDVAFMEQCAAAASGKRITMHRAFDMCRDPFWTMEQVISLGIDTILTSGQCMSCLEGVDLLRQLQAAAAGRIQIMAGGGVNAAVIKTLAAATDLCTFHMSGKETLDSKMRYRKGAVSMGLPSLSEYEIWRTSQEKVRAAKNVLGELS
ncbi:MAG: copper homeostasis protein CutC [Lachnospiraceae bacterium]